MALTARVFLLRLAVAATIVLAFSLSLRAGGPKQIAGPTYFDPSMTGQPLVWPQGLITYYTDQGDLSSILPNTSANSFVASSFAVWTSVSTAAIGATSGGELGEDVNGTNVILNADGTISMPADIEPTATGSPVGVVYDADGSVSDALLGAGAGNSSECFSNAVFGGNDNFGSLATYQHALIVINGQCAQQSSQLTDVEYRLVRVIGNVLGLGWSQLNVNVQTGSPAPAPADYAGFPVMHFTDSSYCAPITRCYSNPYQLSTDDVAAISRLYPITTQNQPGFPGKQVFASSTARIHGSVWFTDARGNRTEPMQGVNVVARWIDPSTGLPSRQYAASSVSGFLFTGNAGNPITGFDDALGDPFSEWGSNNTSVEGFFDLAGLPLPNGGSAQYQLSAEGLDPMWSPGVGPYAPGPVSPSGRFSPITVTVTAGADVAQDILMAGTAQPLPQAASSWTSPAAMPSGGDWQSSLNGYGDTAYFLLPAQANRTLSVAVTALDESGSSSEVKTQPIIGMWAASDPQGTGPPTFTSSPFNELTFGMTRLDTQVLAAGNFLIGISDLRGDGRPDYRYHAHVLYADSAFPSRVSVSGGAFTIQGTGFAPGLTATIGNVAASQLAVSAGQMTLAASANADGPRDITVTDPVSGASTTMTGALTYGAAATDSIVLLYGLNPSTPVGTQATHPVSVRVFAGVCLRWGHSRQRRYRRLERHQFRAAFRLRRSVFLLRPVRSERIRRHVAHSRGSRGREHHCGSGSRILPFVEVCHRNTERHRIHFRYRSRIALRLRLPGSVGHSAHHCQSAEQRNSKDEHASRFHDRERLRDSQRRRRANKLYRLCHRHVDADAVRFAGPAQRLRSARQCSLRHLARESRSAFAATAAASLWCRADIQ
ncbi:MAG: IPT/TIG domain-containing protein [Candidatus Sulfotelmatobacter sp.]